MTDAVPNPDHPTGKHLCAKVRAAPSLLRHPDRLLYPLRRTNPKGSDDPGWQRISWDKVLDVTASNMKRIANNCFSIVDTWIRLPFSLILTTIEPVRIEGDIDDCC